MSTEAALRALLDAVAPLMDREVVQPFRSAWEFDALAGDDLHAKLTEAYEQARKALAQHDRGVDVTITVGPPPPPEVRYVPVPIPPTEPWLRA